MGLAMREEPAVDKPDPRAMERVETEEAVEMATPAEKTVPYPGETPPARTPVPIAVWEMQKQTLEGFIRSHLDRRLAARVDVADILQEVYLDLADGVPVSVLVEGASNEPGSSIRRWFLRITARRIGREHRKHLGAASRDVRRDQPMPDPNSDDDPRRSVPPLVDERLETPSRLVIRSERSEAIMASFAKLSPIDREILAMRGLEGLTNEECARRLGLSRSAASNRYERAKLRLRTVLGATPIDPR